MAVDFAMNGMMHRAFLRELDRVQGFVESGDTPAARRHYGFFSDLLHQHHEGEDTFLFALVRERSTDPDALATIDALEAEHEQLHAALDTCDDDFSGSGPLPADTVADLKALRMVLAAHCAHEEADVRAVERLVRVGGDVDGLEQREGAVDELHRGALGGLEGRLDLEEAQAHLLVGAEQLAGGDAEEDRVADLAGGAGDGDGLGHQWFISWVT